MAARIGIFAVETHAVQRGPSVVPTSPSAVPSAIRVALPFVVLSAPDLHVAVMEDVAPQIFLFAVKILVLLQELLVVMICISVTLD